MAPEGIRGETKGKQNKLYCSQSVETPNTIDRTKITILTYGPRGGNVEGRHKK